MSEKALYRSRSPPSYIDIPPTARTVSALMLRSKLAIGLPVSYCSCLPVSVSKEGNSLSKSEPIPSSVPVTGPAITAPIKPLNRTLPVTLRSGSHFNNIPSKLLVISASSANSAMVSLPATLPVFVSQASNWVANLVAYASYAFIVSLVGAASSNLLPSLALSSAIPPTPIKAAVVIAAK